MKKSKTNIFKILGLLVIALFLFGGTVNLVVKALPDDELTEEVLEEEEPKETDTEEEVVADPVEEEKETVLEEEDTLPPITEQGFFTRLFGGIGDLFANPKFAQIMNWVLVGIGFVVAIWAKIRSGQIKVKAAKAKYDFELMLAEKTKLTTENEEVKAMLLKADKQAEAMKNAMILAFDRSNLKEDVKDKIKAYFDEVEQLEPITVETLESEVEQVEQEVEKVELVNKQEPQEVKPLEW